MNFNLKYIIIIFIFFLFSCSTHKDNSIKNKYKISDKKTIKSPVDFPGKIYEIGENLYFTTDKLSYNLCIFDSFGKVIKKVGSKGRGPGEFENILSSSFTNNKLYIFDNLNARISIFNKNLDFIGSFIPKNRYDRNVVRYKNKLFTIGRHIEDPSDRFKSYNLLDIYLREKDRWEYQKSDIFLKNIPVEIKKSNLPVTNHVVDCVVGDNLYILHSLNPEIIIYNLETGKWKIQKYSFPDYVGIKNINFRRLYKKYHKRYFRGFSSFVSSPIFIAYDKYKKIFITQFNIPFQNVIANENNKKHKIVIFDNNFNYLWDYDTNEFILGSNFTDTETTIITTNLFSIFIDEEEPDYYNLHFYEIK